MSKTKILFVVDSDTGYRRSETQTVTCFGNREQLVTSIREAIDLFVLRQDLHRRQAGLPETEPPATFPETASDKSLTSRQRAEKYAQELALPESEQQWMSKKFRDNSSWLTYEVFNAVVEAYLQGFRHRGSVDKALAENRFFSGQPRYYALKVASDIQAVDKDEEAS